jgi:hypothetical protein
MPATDKVEFYSEDESKPNRLYGGVNFDTLGEKCWMDTLELVYPLPSGRRYQGPAPQATEASVKLQASFRQTKI